MEGWGIGGMERRWGRMIGGVGKGDWMYRKRDWRGRGCSGDQVEDEGMGIGWVGSGMDRREDETVFGEDECTGEMRENVGIAK